MALEKNEMLDKKISFQFLCPSCHQINMYYVLYVTCTGTLFLSYYIKVFTIGKKYSMQNKLN